jgi:hypothetical protein
MGRGPMAMPTVTARAGQSRESFPTPQLTRKMPEPECPVCHSPLPAAKPRGRPRVYCSRVCTERARTRVRQAAGLLDYADIVEAHVGRPGFGSEEYLRGRAAEIRRKAAELLDGLPV